MMLKLRGTTAKAVAIRIQRELSGPKAPKLHLLPYNRFDLSGENTWWLTRSSQNPAYAFGKFFCSNDEDHCGPMQVRCGLYVEKGFEDGAEDPAQRLLADWEWHRLVPALISGEFTNAVKAAADAIGTPLRIHVVANLADQKEDFSADTKDGTLTGVSTKLSPGIKAFRRLRGCTTLADLGTLLSGDVRKELSWGWINFYVSSLFKLVSTGADDIVQCAQMLEQFEPWVQNAKKGESRDR